MNPSLSSTALHGPRPLEPAKSYSTYAIFIASSLNDRTRSLYCGMSSGDRGLGEFGPNAYVRYEVISSTSLSPILPPPSPAIMTSRMNLTLLRQPFSSHGVDAIVF